MDIDEKDETPVIHLATLNQQQAKFLSQVSLDIRTTVSNLSLPEVSALSVLDATAIECLKDLYYALNSEDPLNVMPVRRHVLESKLPMDCLVPIAVSADNDPAAPRNRKRWSLPTYQTLRLFSVLTLPISESSELPSPSQLDYLLLDLRFRLASHRKVLATFVSLLQYYVDRKSEKRAALLPAEESKVEDARIDNILRFFGNLLSPPRLNVGQTIIQRDRAVHLALVGSLVEVDFFSTLVVLFSSEDDSQAHYTDLVFLVAEIYGLAYRHTSPLQMIRASRFIKNDPTLVKMEVKNDPAGTTEEPNIVRSVFDDDYNNQFDKEVNQQSSKVLPAPPASAAGSSGLRDALLRERATIGGSRAATVSARWTSRHSGGFTRAIRKPGEAKLQLKSVRNPNGVTGSGVSNLVIPAKRAIQSTKVFNVKHDLQEKVHVNSELLCLQSAKKKKAYKDLGKKQALPTVRLDLQDDGLKGLVKLTSEMIDISFEFFVRELRSRILETRERAQADETDVLKKAEQSYLTIVGSVVGFHREKCGKVYKKKQTGRNQDEVSDKSTLLRELHKNDIKSILSTDFKIIKTEWKQVEAAIELESFQMVFGILADACSNLREGSKEENKTSLIELSTFSVLEMIKMLQGMAAVVAKEIEEAEEGKQGNLTPRELALNTLEQLFEREAFLNAPADLAKLFTTKMFSFRHLANIVEMAHAFTSILLDEQELSRIAVAKTRRRRRKLLQSVREEEDEEFKLKQKDKTSTANLDSSEPTATRASTEGDGTNEAIVMDIDQPGKENEPNNVKDGHEDKEDRQNGSIEAGKEVASAKAADAESTAAKAADTEGASAKAADTEDASAKEAEAEERKPELSALEKMLQADEEDLAKGKTFKSTPRPLVTNKEPISQVEKMLQADEQADISGAPQPEYVHTVDGATVDPKSIPEILNETNTDDEEDDFGDEMREVESIGIVRRFASTKAIETLLIPVRAALCSAAELSGKVFATPEGCECVLAPSVVAKSASVTWAIWKVSELRERGAPCAQFFSFGVLHLLGIALKAQNDGLVAKQSVLGQMASLGKDVTQVFFKWLQCNPGLMYDMFVVMDKSYTMSFARKVNHDHVDPDFPKSERKKRKKKDDDEDVDQISFPTNTGASDKRKKGEGQNKERVFSSDDEFDDSDLLFGSGSDSDKEFPVPRSAKRDNPRKRSKQDAAKRVSTRKRKLPTTAEEDEDVDDLDALRFGGGEFSSSEDENEKGKGKGLSIGKGKEKEPQKQD